MPNAVRFEVQGLRQLGEAFKGLDDVVQRKLAGQATGAGARIVKGAAKNNLKRNPSIDTGLVEKNVITKKLSKSKSEGLTSAHIVTEKRVRYPTNNRQGRRTTRRSGAALEFGTVKMQAEPWLGPALSQNLGQVTNAIKDKLATGISAQARKTAK